MARRIAESRDVADATRSETAKLHAGDFENRVLWDQFMPHCLAALQAVYDRLDIKHDVHLGESFYDPMLAGVVQDLEARGLAVPSEGATVVFTEGFKAPLIVRKRDGAYNYATTDLATVKYRRDLAPDLLFLYVVDHRQGDHFKQLFAARQEVGLRPDRDGARRLRHGPGQGQAAVQDPRRRRDRPRVAPGRGRCSRPGRWSTRTAPTCAEEQRREIAEVVGLGAIKYADLSQNRLSDYVFDMAKMVALNGNTATYLQYAYARIQSIFRKGEVDPRGDPPGPAGDRPLQPGRAGPGRADLAVPETLELAAAELKPNILADYLFDLANAYSTFYEECPVLKAESPGRRDSRLALIDLTARTLARGSAPAGDRRGRRDVSASIMPRIRESAHHLRVLLIIGFRNPDPSARMICGFTARRGLSPRRARPILTDVREDRLLPRGDHDR